MNLTSNEDSNLEILGIISGVSSSTFLIMLYVLIMWNSMPETFLPRRNYFRLYYINDLLSNNHETAIVISNYLHITRDLFIVI
jgi:hypothetical protein